MHRQVVERCSGDHAHVAVQYICRATTRFAQIVVTANMDDALLVAHEAICDPSVTHILGEDRVVYLN